jgi:hypothetical protein
MKKYIGIWVDHKKAFVVSMDNDNERLNKHHLRHYYRKIIRLIGDPRIISIFGPGEARTELKKEIKRSKRLASKIISIEPADKMT